MSDQALYQDAANQAAQQYGVPPQIFSALVDQESGWNVFPPDAGAGAIGLTQLEPSTAADLGVNPFDPIQNLQGGAKYLSQLFKQFGNWTTALEAYFEGQGNIQRGNFGTSADYANSVLSKATALGLPATTPNLSPAVSTPAASPAPSSSGFDPKTMTWNGKPISTWDQILSSIGIGGSTTGPASQTGALGNVLLYGLVIFGLGVVSFFAVKSLFPTAAVTVQAHP